MTTRPYIELRSMDELVRTSDYLGSYFFNKDTMRSFGTRLTNALYPVSVGNKDGQPQVGWFVTTESSVETWWTGRGAGRQAVIRRYVVKQSDQWDISDRHDVIEFDTIISGLTDTRKAKRIAMLAAGIERADGLEAAIEFVNKTFEVTK